MPKLLRRGKVKDLYINDDGSLQFHFTDRVSAFDVILPSIIPRKGEILCQFAAYWFRNLGVENHMMDVVDKDRMNVRNLSMLPIECIVRGYAYGSFYERIRTGDIDVPHEMALAERLPEPIFDPTTKSDEKDLPVSEAEILRNHWLETSELEEVRRRSLEIYANMAHRAELGGFILADLKLEFGRDERKQILLADSIGPDEFRLWPKEKYAVGRNQESYDKQPIRDWLASISYKEQLETARKEGGELPTPPILPMELIEETTKRYIFAYKVLTGLEL
ncbi:phosphoribosylaminoimidazolesuccinocarboxamide synthase [Candidatus Bathyarchaeota archaeon]|nr:phosphoribosylaminoimidazolesuccinocarboxamide synthase [Nitrososphaerota archaeon]MBQ04844.1 phosphoribosylaminoimidazolesuccinocarboxamide synthase [Candidatus Bathyarchaeota archaeon]|tara:strand:+ start:2752 stop:3582 length:831 start_codon:yes stop_codon:yes gene_type:complete